MIEYTQNILQKKDEKVLISGLEVDEVIKKYGIPRQDLEFLPLDEDLVKKEGIRVLFLGHFENIQPQENFYLDQELQNFKLQKKELREHFQGM